MMGEAIRGLWFRPWLTLSGLVLGVLLAPSITYSVSALVDLRHERGLGLGVRVLKRGPVT